MLDRLLVVVCLVILMFITVSLDSPILAIFVVAGALAWPFRAFQRSKDDHGDKAP